MKANERYITWQPVLTDHQAFTYEALSQVSGRPVLAYVSSMENETRKKQGWADTEVKSIERILIPCAGFLYYCYTKLKENQESIHIFASPFHDPKLIICLFMAALLKIQFYLISEPYSPNSDGYLTESSQLLGLVKKILRPYLYKCYSILLRYRLSGIFAISPLALKQYEKAGVPRHKLFEFGYFVPRVYCPIAIQEKPIINSEDHYSKKQLRLIFVGALIKRKGIDLLVNAIDSLHQQGFSITLDIYGYGENSVYTMDKPAVAYKGVIPFGGSQLVIGQYDLLVMPSRYDGWGVVVNEAICAGVPVLTSDATGAGMVARYLGAGLTFEAGNLEALKDALLSLIEKPKLLELLQKSTNAAGDVLQPLNAAYYMNKILNKKGFTHNSIRPLWSFYG